MNGFVGSRLKVPMYTPRLPGLGGGGGGGVFQPRGADLTTYKPNRWGEAVGGLGQLFATYMAGEQRRKERARQRVMDMLKMGQLDPSVYQSPEYQKARSVSGYPAMTMPPALGLEKILSQRPEGYAPPTVTTGRYGRVKGLTYRPRETYPEGFKEDLTNAISAIERGADPYKVYQRLAKEYPKQSIDLKRILFPKSSGAADNILDTMKSRMESW